MDSGLLEFLGSEWLRKLELGVVDESLGLGEDLLGEGVEIVEEVGPDSLAEIVGALGEGDEA